jgi:uncharacterized protein YuzE
MARQLLLPITMEHRNTVQFRAPLDRPPTIEFDSSAMAWYIRFRSAKVAKTISEDTPGCVYAIDLDADNRVIGFELLGVRHFSISAVRRITAIDTSKVDFERARFMPAACRPSEVPA